MPTAIKVGLGHFSGGSKVASAGDQGLAAIVRGIAIDHARIKLQDAAFTDFTDSSTGVAASAVAAMTVPTAAYDGQTSGASPATAFNTAAGAHMDAMAVMGDHVNKARAQLGLPMVSWASGSVSTAGTIPAQTKALTATNGATAIDFDTGVSAMKIIRNNVAKMTYAVNEVLVAIGRSEIADNSGGDLDRSYIDSTTPTTGTAGTGSPAGATSISDTVMDAFLDAAANNVATLAKAYNDALLGAASLADLTDNSGGTANGDTVASVSTTLTAHQDGGTDSSPQAGLDAELPKLDNNIADLAARINELALAHGVTGLTDNSGGTADTTLEVIDDTLTAVSGAGTDSAPYAGSQAIVDDFADNIATLVAATNRLCPVFGLTSLTDSSGGTASTTNTLVASAALGAAVNNSASATGLSDTEVDAWLDTMTDAFATIAAKLNEMSGTDAAVEGLHVVAAV